MGWLCVLPIVAVASQALNSDDGHFVDELILGCQGTKQNITWERSSELSSLKT